jgi:hypothetical protein
MHKITEQIIERERWVKPPNMPMGVWRNGRVVCKALSNSPNRRSLGPVKRRLKLGAIQHQQEGPSEILQPVSQTTQAGLLQERQPNSKPMRQAL